jgi:protein-tyrosine-phosphatase
MEGQAIPKKRVLIVCTGNSARSQMAEGLLRHEAGDVYEVYSAGTHPGSVRPEAVQVMSEIHIDITGQFSKPVEQFIGQGFDYVITVCDKARENCPAFPGGPTGFTGHSTIHPERSGVMRPGCLPSVRCGTGFTQD